MTPRNPLLLVALLPLAACGPGDPLDGLTLVGDDPSGAPIDGLTDDQLSDFRIGDALFEQPFRESQGLGPAYIRFACSSCHVEDGRGPGIVTKMVAVEADGITAAADQSALPWGHTVRNQVAGGAQTPIDVPASAEGLLVTDREPPAVFGRGYMEAVLASEIERVEAEQAQRTDGISGRINRVPWASETNPDTTYHAYQPGDTGLIGRFGLKGRVATVDEFVADAFQGDMSLTSPLRPQELANPDGLTDDAHPGLDLDADDINLVAAYVRLLALPSRAGGHEDGAAVFERIQCAACHVPTMRTDPAYPIAQIAGIDAPLYTDLLLHDMGADGADALAEHDASGTEWKTAPLIGLRFSRALMHDGRAATVEDAILAHGGEGSEANDSLSRFQALSEDDRAALIAFVESL